MCLVSRQLGFVISPKFSYYLVPRSTTSPLILSSLVSQHPDILRFAFSPFFLSLPFFFFFPTIVPIGLFAPHFPLKIPPRARYFAINAYHDRFSNCMFSLPRRRSSLPFNSHSFVRTRVRTRGEPFRGFEFRFNRSTIRRRKRGTVYLCIGIGRI